MMLTRLRAQHALTLMLLIPLATGCAFDSPPPSVVAPPAIPPLPVQARQPTVPALCLTTCSKGFEQLENGLQPSLTSPASPASPASAPTAH